MKTLFLKLVLAILVLSYALPTSAQLRFGPKVGVNYSKIVAGDKYVNYQDQLKWKWGFHAGGTVEYWFNPILAMEMGLLFSNKGYDLENTSIYGAYTIVHTARVNLSYLEIPYTLKAAYSMGDAKIYALAGPYLGIGLVGNAKGEDVYAGNSYPFDSEIKWGTGRSYHFKRMDGGLTMGLGAEYKSMALEFRFGLGLVNNSPDNDFDQYSKHRVFSMSLGYKFGHKD